MYFKCIWNTF